MFVWIFREKKNIKQCFYVLIEFSCKLGGTDSKLKFKFCENGIFLRNFVIFSLKPYIAMHFLTAFGIEELKQTIGQILIENCSVWSWKPTDEWWKQKNEKKNLDISLWHSYTLYIFCRHFELICMCSSNFQPCRKSIEDIVCWCKIFFLLQNCHIFM